MVGSRRWDGLSPGNVLHCDPLGEGRRPQSRARHDVLIYDLCIVSNPFLRAHCDHKPGTALPRKGAQDAKIEEVDFLVLRFLRILAASRTRVGGKFLKAAIRDSLIGSPRNPRWVFHPRPELRTSSFDANFNRQKARPEVQHDGGRPNHERVARFSFFTSGLILAPSMRQRA